MDSGLGYCNANLNSFVNPYSTNRASWSTIIPDFRYATNCQHEGFGFLGIGTFILLSIFMYFIFKKGKRYFNEIATTIKKHGFFITFNFFLFGLALGFNLTLGDKLIYDFNESTKIFELFSTFRSSGRYIALPATLITIFLLIVTQKFMSSKKSTFLLLSLCLLSFVDQYTAMYSIRNNQSIERSKEYANLEKLFSRNNFKNVIFISPEVSAYRWKDAILLEASAAGVPANDGFVARPSRVKLSNEIDRTNEILRKLDFDSRNLYVMYPSKVQEYSPEVSKIIESSSNFYLDDALLFYDFRN
jgi:hypothetical protein